MFFADAVIDQGSVDLVIVAPAAITLPSATITLGKMMEPTPTKASLSTVTCPLLQASLLALPWDRLLEIHFSTFH